MKRARTIVASVLIASGCSVFAPRDEFVAYRAYRYEAHSPRATALGAEYLARYPNGRFVSEVRGAVGGHEEDFWEEHRASLDGLRAYLEAYPHGTHADEARARVGVYDQEHSREIGVQRARDEAERQRLAAQRAQEAEARRFFARTTIRDWLRRLGGLDGWGQSIRYAASHNAEFNAQFGEASPAPRCGGGRCRKQWTVDFFVPVPGRSAMPRRLTMSLDLLHIPQPLVQGQLVMRQRGLSTWFEEEQQQAVDVHDQAARTQSVHWAMDQLRGIVAQTFPEACETPGSLVGPEPEMEGEVSEGDAPATADGADAGAPAGAEAAPPATTPAGGIPPQPLGVQWSYVVGCHARCGAVISVPDDARPSGWAEATTAPTPPHACLRIDAYAAPDIEGVSTDEGLRISWIPSGGGAAAPAAPAAPAPGGHPAHPARRHPAH